MAKALPDKIREYGDFRVLVLVLVGTASNPIHRGPFQLEHWANLNPGRHRDGLCRTQRIAANLAIWLCVKTSSANISFLMLSPSPKYPSLFTLLNFNALIVNIYLQLRY